MFLYPWNSPGRILEGLPLHSPEIPNPGIEPGSLALSRFFTVLTTREARPNLGEPLIVSVRSYARVAFIIHWNRVLHFYIHSICYLQITICMTYNFICSHITYSQVTLCQTLLVFFYLLCNSHKFSCLNQHSLVNSVSQVRDWAG